MRGSASASRVVARERRPISVSTRPAWMGRSARKRRSICARMNVGPHRLTSRSRGPPRFTPPFIPSSDEPGQPNSNSNSPVGVCAFLPPVLASLRSHPLHLTAVLCLPHLRSRAHATWPEVTGPTTALGANKQRYPPRAPFYDGGGGDDGGKAGGGGDVRFEQGRPPLLSHVRGLDHSGDRGLNGLSGAALPRQPTTTSEAQVHVVCLVDLCDLSWPREVENVSVQKRQYRLNGSEYPLQKARKRYSIS